MQNYKVFLKINYKLTEIQKSIILVSDCYEKKFTTTTRITGCTLF